MSCQGPFVNGTGASWCGCSCNCCPPAGVVPCVQLNFIPPPVITKTCSSSYTNFSANLVLAGVDPPCGFQFAGCNDAATGTIAVVGTGTIDVSPDTITVPGCGVITVLLNGMVPPIAITDGANITVTLGYGGWNARCCAARNACPTACLTAPPAMAMRNLFRYKLEDGKIKTNPETGKPLVVIDKKELLRRIAARNNKLRSQNK